VEERASRHSEADAVEIYAPFMAPYEFFREHGHPRLAQRPWPHRRASLDPFRLFRGTRLFRENGSIAWRRARQGHPHENRHNTVYFPNIMIKGPIQLVRVFKPIAANKTLVEAGPSASSTRPTCCWNAP